MDKRYVKIQNSFGADGLGIPTISIYFSYCDKKDLTGEFCNGCHNYRMQEDGYGDLLSVSECLEIVMKKYQEMKEMCGECEIAFIGGEPTSEINKEFLLKVSNILKNNGFKTILYTWKKHIDLEEIYFDRFDRIVCGEYDDGKKVEGYDLATSNQYVVNSKKEVILEYTGGNK